ncbi:MAG: hypothetical protein JWN01_888 [Patescibacteria group bacterium]|nr:hypothetical protein [Patescibacteria group bacterium]
MRAFHKCLFLGELLLKFYHKKYQSENKQCIQDLRVTFAPLSLLLLAANLPPPLLTNSTSLLIHALCC